MFPDNNMQSIERALDAIARAIRPDATGLGWQELGRDTVAPSTTKTSLNVDFSKTPKKYLRILVLQHSGLTTLVSGVRFNTDSSTNYAYRSTENGGADSSATNQTWLQMGANALEGMHAEFQVVNEAQYRKVLHGVETFWDTAGALYRNTYAGYWQNNSVQVTAVQLVATTGAFRPGSEIIVLGRD